jgi:hypothetical protein
MSGGGLTLAKAYNRDEMTFVNLLKDFTKQIRVGAEYALQQTHYVNNMLGLNRPIPTFILLYILGYLYFC